MSRTRWKSVAAVATLAGGAFLLTGSAAFAEPEPGPYQLELRLAADCPGKDGAVSPVDP